MQGVDAAVGASWKLFEGVGQPACRIESVELGSGIRALDSGSVAARRELAKRQYFLPMAMRRIAFSIGLLSMVDCPIVSVFQVTSISPELSAA
jgi:hypothetical protein